MDLDVICNSFFHDNKSTASAALLSYQRQNNKSHSPLSVINYIINTKEFKEYYDETFLSVYNTIFAIPNYINDLKKDFITLCLKNQKGFTKLDIQNYIKESKQFNEYYLNLIKEIHKFYYTNDLDDTKEIMEQIKKINFVNESNIKKSLETILFSMNSNNNTKTTKFNLEEFKEYFITKFTKDFNTEPTIDHIVHFNQFIENKCNIVDMYISSKYHKKSSFTYDIISQFKHIFKRDVSVFEYVKYHDYFSINQNNNIQSYYTNFINKYDLVSNIFKTYLDKTTNHTEFIYLFLDFIELHNDQFIEHIINIVTNYKSYNQVMIQKIEQLYQSTFNKKVSLIDKTYFFQKVYERKLNLIDEELPKLVSTLKKETDNFEEQIESSFNNILQRKPERLEIDLYIEYFRNPLDDLRPQFRLRNELYESLEYHDIIKQFIINIIQEHTKNTPSKSIVFKYLNTILHLEDKHIKCDINKLKEYLIHHL